VIEPYLFIRTVTFALGLTWTVMGLARAVRFAASWKEKLEEFGLDARPWRRWIAVACLRATVLDPINLALMCMLVGLWTLP
jgi:hypothetical protein